MKENRKEARGREVESQQEYSATSYSGVDLERILPKATSRQGRKIKAGDSFPIQV